MTAVSSNSDMYRTGALVLSSSRLLLPALAAAARVVSGVLYIPLTVTRAEDARPVTSEDEQSFLVDASQQINQVYFNVSRWSTILDVRILLPQFPSLTHAVGTHSPPLQHDVDVLLSPLSSFEKVQEAPSYQLLSQRVQNDLRPRFQKIDVESEVDINQGAGQRSVPEVAPSLQFYNSTVIGGTFDSIHNGHRLLLTHSSLIAKSRILVGVADGPLLASKVLPELISPVENRISTVRQFLQDVKPSISHDVVMITDVYGPTAWDDTLECLVVTSDTARGGEKVNTLRKSKGLQSLVVHVVELIGSSEAVDTALEDKLSSSDIRRSKLGSYRPVPDLGCLPSYSPSQGPYLIGLTGGIATGKSAIFNRLINMGAFPIDCDKLGHEAYKPGRPAYSKIIEVFGEGVLSDTGEINRKVLGPLVFSDKAKLQRLNEIVWPEIWRLVEEKIQQAGEEGFQVCVIDAAVMLKAGWDKFLHEIWVTIAPEKEVMRRVMERDNLTEEAARRRMAAQLTPAEYVQHAHVVFSTQWEPDFTQKQVEKAWKELQTRIHSRSKI